MGKWTLWRCSSCWECVYWRVLHRTLTNRIRCMVLPNNNFFQYHSLKNIAVHVPILSYHVKGQWVESKPQAWNLKMSQWNRKIIYNCTQTMNIGGAMLVSRGVSCIISRFSSVLWFVTWCCLLFTCNSHLWFIFCSKQSHLRCKHEGNS